MSSRPLIKPEQVIISGNMATTLVSSVTIITNISMISYACSWAGSTPVGAVTVEASNDYSIYSDGTVKTAGTWNTLPLSSTASVSGNTGNGAIDIDANALYAIRLRYTPVSGTGVFQATVVGKVA